MRTLFWLLGHVLYVVRLLRTTPSEVPFMTRAMAGEFDVTQLDDAIDDAIDEWHKSKSGKPLYEFLGLTRIEYKAWVEQTLSVKDLLEGRILKR